MGSNSTIQTAKKDLSSAVVKPPVKSEVDVRLELNNAVVDLKMLNIAHWTQTKKIYEGNTKMLTEAELVLQAVFEVIGFKPKSWRDVCAYVETSNMLNSIFTFNKDQLVEYRLDQLQRQFTIQWIDQEELSHDSVACAMLARWLQALMVYYGDRMGKRVQIMAQTWDRTKMQQALALLEKESK